MVFYKICQFHGHFIDFICTRHWYGFSFIASLTTTFFAVQQHQHPPVFHRVRGTPMSFPRQSTPTPGFVTRNSYVTINVLQSPPLAGVTVVCGQYIHVITQCSITYNLVTLISEILMEIEKKIISSSCLILHSSQLLINYLFLIALYSHSPSLI